MKVRDEFQSLIEETLEGFKGLSLDKRQQISAYAADRADHLSRIAHEPGFAQAVEREAQNVAMRAGVEISNSVGATESMIYGVIGGALRIVAVALM